MTSGVEQNTCQPKSSFCYSDMGQLAAYGCLKSVKLSDSPSERPSRLGTCARGGRRPKVAKINPLSGYHPGELCSGRISPDVENFYIYLYRLRGVFSRL